MEGRDGEATREGSGAGRGGAVGGVLGRRRTVGRPLVRSIPHGGGRVSAGRGRRGGPDRRTDSRADRRVTDAACSYGGGRRGSSSEPVPRPDALLVVDDAGRRLARRRAVALRVRSYVAVVLALRGVQFSALLVS